MKPPKVRRECAYAMRVMPLSSVVAFVIAALCTDRNLALFISFTAVFFCGYAAHAMWVWAVLSEYEE